MDESNWLESQIGIRTSICKNLHAKCYLNEGEAIITSMNLYEFSQANNNEMGIHFTKEQDPDLYAKAFEEVQRLLTISEEIRVSVRKINIDTSNNKPEAKNNNNSKIFVKSGYCIRTGVEIPFNPERPLSYEAFKRWNEWGDPDYPEKYCHFSGEPSNGETCVNKPILYKNWNKAKEAFSSFFVM